MGHRSYISPEGEAYPSVTEVLNYPPKPWLEKWKEDWGKRAEQKIQAAINIGTEFHLCTEDDQKETSTNRLKRMVEEFFCWVIENGFKVKEKELHVVSHMYHYAGTFDAVGTLGKSKELCLFDWKTSSGIYPDMALQLSAYAQAYKEQTGVKIKTGYIVHVSKDKPNHKLTVKRYTLGKRLFNKFLKRLNAYRDHQQAQEANSEQQTPFAEGV